MDKSLKYIYDLLNNAKIPESLPDDYKDIEGLEEIDKLIRSFRGSIYALGVGDLHRDFDGKGYLMGTVKNLQSILKNLVWHIEAISRGDFSQEVAFLGEFSQAFNSMSKRIMADIQELKDKEEEILRLSEIDGLTKLYNRHKLDLLLENEIERSTRNKNTFTIALLDIDDFKRINDNYGHLVGDNTLQLISRTIKEHIRKLDYVGRWGGEEFLIIFPETKLKNAKKVVERVRLAIENLQCQKCKDITASFGLAAFSEGMDLIDLLKGADQALYAAKDNGKNKIFLYENYLA